MAQNIEYAASIIASRDELEKMRITQWKIRYESYQQKKFLRIPYYLVNHRN